MTSVLPGASSVLKEPFIDRIRGKRVLVTGAGGSIGSALVQALLVCKVSSLILLDHSEFALYELERSLLLTSRGQVATCVLGSTGDHDLLKSIFEQHRPQIVFHAAAFKHVPLLEQNPFAAIANNVQGTHALIEAAVAYGVSEFIQVSTDKAVDPRSIMGASKRIAELLLIGAADRGTRMSAVRLGNVWASQGSVVALFLEQIATGVPLTVTDENASRYFMTMDEAVSAILAALEPRPDGIVLVPALRDPVRIVDLARGLLDEHKSSASVVFTGLRPGDKLTESLVSEREVFLPRDAHAESLLRGIVSPAPPLEKLLKGIAALRTAVAAYDLDGLLDAVRQIVPEYEPSETLLALSSKKSMLGGTRA